MLLTCHTLLQDRLSHSGQWLEPLAWGNLASSCDIDRFDDSTELSTLIEARLHVVGFLGSSSYQGI